MGATCQSEDARDDRRALLSLVDEMSAFIGHAVSCRWWAGAPVPVDNPPCTCGFNRLWDRLNGEAAPPVPDPDRDLFALLTRQFAWSLATFGGAYSKAALLKHIRKELDEEIEKDPNVDPVEWIDVALLALDGAWRCTGLTGGQVAQLVVEKMARNRARKWNVRGGDEPNEHVRDA